jgi:5-hydroxyisourate hydrolase
MTSLTTHILDTANGHPAAGVRIYLRNVASPAMMIAEAVTDSNGRATLVPEASNDLPSGVYELIFAMGPYFKTPASGQAFLDDIVLRIGIDASQSHYHIPLLATPWSYTTYRGS